MLYRYVLIKKLCLPMNLLHKFYCCVIMDITHRTLYKRRKIKVELHLRIKKTVPRINCKTEIKTTCLR
jgi:hypothetical protein